MLEIFVIQDKYKVQLLIRKYVDLVDLFIIIFVILHISIIVQGSWIIDCRKTFKAPLFQCAIKEFKSLYTMTLSL